MRTLALIPLLALFLGAPATASEPPHLALHAGTATAVDETGPIIPQAIRWPGVMVAIIGGMFGLAILVGILSPKSRPQELMTDPDDDDSHAGHASEHSAH